MPLYRINQKQLSHSICHRTVCMSSHYVCISFNAFWKVSKSAIVLDRRYPAHARIAISHRLAITATGDPPVEEPQRISSESSFRLTTGPFQESSLLKRNEFVLLAGLLILKRMNRWIHSPSLVRSLMSRRRYDRYAATPASMIGLDWFMKVRGTSLRAANRVANCRHCASLFMSIQ